MMKNKTSRVTGFLYARPSFLEGLSRVIDFENLQKEYNTSSSSEQADERAIQADWIAVGNDLCEIFKIGRK
jgi:hypothetical protein